MEHVKLVRFGNPGHELPGVLDSQGTIRSLEGVIHDWSGAFLSDESIERVRLMDVARLPAVPAGTRIGPCVGHVPKFICIGLNYADHAAEAGMAVPPEPVVFSKQMSCLSGPNDPIIVPRGSLKTVWEV
jgi:ureidoglycolate lyase/2,4-diketo-3-deoxy-L-fuconate hydrolase